MGRKKSKGGQVCCSGGGICHHCHQSHSQNHRGWWCSLYILVVQPVLQNLEKYFKIFNLEPTGRGIWLGSMGGLTYILATSASLGLGCLEIGRNG